MIDLWILVGIIAVVLTNLGLFSQIVRGIRTKKLDDLSYWMVSFLTVGMSMWLAYGIHINDFVVISANIVGVAFAATLIVLKKVFSKSVAVTQAV